MTVLSVITSTVISIHALREESDPRADQSGQRRQISIHALREESDLQCLNHRSAAWLFQSTLSVRRATTVFNHLRDGIGISIHALREESDPKFYWHAKSQEISIHALREESDSTSPRCTAPGWVFQSTLSVRRATRQTTQGLR